MQNRILNIHTLLYPKKELTYLTSLSEPISLTTKENKEIQMKFMAGANEDPEKFPENAEIFTLTGYCLNSEEEKAEVCEIKFFKKSQAGIVTTILQ